MHTAISEKINAAVSTGNPSEIHSVLAEYLQQKLTDEEEGEMYTLILRLYMKANADLNGELAGVLQESIAKLNTLNSSQQVLDDAVKMGEARKLLK